MKYIIANLKMYQNLNTAKQYANDLEKLSNSSNKIIICPTTCYLSLYNGKNYELGSQDVSANNLGSYTGEVAAECLKELNVKYTIVGHSERRKYLNETSSMFINKISNLFNNDMKIIFCVGETLEEKQNNNTFETISESITSVFNGLPKNMIKNIIIAYEPIWAIGTRLTPTNEEISEISEYIKINVKKYYDTDIPVLYGGSVNDENISSFCKITNIDGFLIGGASLDINKLNKIIDSID